MPPVDLEPMIRVNGQSHYVPPFEAPELDEPLCPPFPRYESNWMVAAVIFIVLAWCMVMLGVFA